MKQKSKPIARADIRERMERKFRARGALAFHLLLILGAGILLLYNLPELSASRYSFGRFVEFTSMYGIFCGTGALHFIRYYFRHGRGRDQHDVETEARIQEQLRHADAEEAEEQEELVRLQMDDKLKNRRLIWQHIVIFTAIAGVFIVGHAGNMPGEPILDWGLWRDVVTFFGVWGIGLAAHILRYVFAYGSMSAQRQEARIDAQVARELERERRRGTRQAARTNGPAQVIDSQDIDTSTEAWSLEDLEAVQQRMSR